MSQRRRVFSPVKCWAVVIEQPYLSWTDPEWCGRTKKAAIAAYKTVQRRRTSKEWVDIEYDKAKKETRLSVRKVIITQDPTQRYERKKKGEPVKPG